MEEDTGLFVGIDVAKLRNAVALAEPGRDGEVRYYGEVDACDIGMRQLFKKLASRHGRLTICYEAGPTGYGLHRLAKEMGHECLVVAPSLIPKKASDRVKTNRRDALALARLLRAGELTAVWVPDTTHEAMRDLSRARTAAVKDVGIKKRQVSSFLLRHHRIFHRPTPWTKRYIHWLHEQRFDHPADHLVLQEAIDAVRVAQERVMRLDKAMEEFLPSWSFAPVVSALQALRGVSIVTAVNFVVEIGDVRRFENPRQLMGYVGLVPGERSTGDTVRRGAITKMGNARIRQLLVESAWTYRYPASVSAKKLPFVERAPEKVREIAMKAQTRLTRRYRALSARGMKSTVICTAIARELAGFMWAVAREVSPAA